VTNCIISHWYFCFSGYVCTPWQLFSELGCTLIRLRQITTWMESISCILWQESLVAKFDCSRVHFAFLIRIVYVLHDIIRNEWWYTTRSCETNARHTWEVYKEAAVNWEIVEEASVQISSWYYNICRVLFATLFMEIQCIFMSYSVLLNTLPSASY
jgi:hypothetical protein